MKADNFRSNSEQQFSSIAKELRFIRIILSAVCFAAFVALSWLIDRDLPVYVILGGLIAGIVWIVSDTMKRRSSRIAQESAAFMALSGRNNPASPHS